MTKHSETEGGKMLDNSFVKIHRQTVSDLVKIVSEMIDYAETNGSYPAHEIGLKAELLHILRATKEQG